MIQEFFLLVTRSLIKKNCLNFHIKAYKISFLYLHEYITIRYNIFLLNAPAIFLFNFKTIEHLFDPCAY